VTEAPPVRFSRLLLDQRVPMRDGVTLSIDVYLPDEGDGPWPVVMNRTPYDNTVGGLSRYFPETARYFADRGYVWIGADVRGRGDSEGEWVPFFNEGPDGYDTIEWIAQQPWCDGNVGMMGGSYNGFVQWAAARERPPHLRALVSSAAAGRWMHELPYMNGISRPYWISWLNLVGGRTNQLLDIVDWNAVWRHRPFRDLDLALGRTNSVWRTWLQHETFDDYWQPLSLEGHFAGIDVPALHITGWFDGDQWGEMFYWHGMVDESPAGTRQKLLVGPWEHGGVRLPKRSLGGLEFGAEAEPDINAIHARFFDRWLKGIENGVDQEPPVRIFVMGRNEWRDEDQWPPAGCMATPIYFHSDGRGTGASGGGTLDLQAPNGEEPFDSYIYDPDDPTPSQPGAAAPFAAADFDKSWRMDRGDVLVYTGEPLEEDLELSGHPFIILHAASDCPDTDWFVTLCDVFPDGRSMEITAGCMRATHRGGLRATPCPLEPGTIEEFKIEMMATSNIWLSGHRLRVTVASGDYPAARRNPNTNAPTGDDDEVRVATNTVYHTPAHPSHLLAPVVRR
jgi:putative CocE/NonD family hydrolase